MDFFLDLVAQHLTDWLHSWLIIQFLFQEASTHSGMSVSACSLSHAVWPIGFKCISGCHGISIGEGTVFLYCNQVSRALCQLKSWFLGWPDPACKEVISTVIEQAAGFHKCLGSGDGCLI